MLNFKVKRGTPGPTMQPGMIPSKFRQFVVKKEKRLNNLTPEAKVVAALTKCLSIQGGKDKMSYYVSGDSIFCPEITMTEGAPKKPGGPPQNSYSARGRFKIGKSNGSNLTTGVMEFRIKFRDGQDSMGLPDIVIEEADMNELPRSAPLSA